ncbi:MAG: SIS domain-containing protein [Phyllobacteriaceae bacterium]|jgi:D-sedoheptulose 7-phosphate isomerase|nr:SIS domain-containing protein [Phyllobacteriaceae bacterium]
MERLQLTSWLEDARSLLAITDDQNMADTMERAVDAVCTVVRSGKLILVCGNGGSAADAQHIVGELVGRFLKEREAIPAVCLSSNPAVLTSWSNDYSFDTVFARQIEAYRQMAGVVIGLSTSGNSKNVVAAFSAAKANGMTTIGLTGRGGGKMAELCDHLLAVDSSSTPAIQQIHLCLYHFMCARIEQELIGS